MKIVLDASVALTWLLHDAADRDKQHAFDVLVQIETRAVAAVVPCVWGLELANAILRAEKQGRTGPDLTEDFLKLLAGMQIAEDNPTALHVFAEVLPLAQRFKLSAYDAAYLELAQRLSLPLATLDDDLRRVARKAGVKLFKP